jgi:hypothetical protein
MLRIPFDEIEELYDPCFLRPVLLPRADAEVRVREEIRPGPPRLPLLVLLMLRAALLILRMRLVLLALVRTGRLLGLLLIPGGLIGTFRSILRRVFRTCGIRPGPGLRILPSPMTRTPSSSSRWTSIRIAGLVRSLRPVLLFAGLLLMLLVLGHVEVLYAVQSCDVN